MVNRALQHPLESQGRLDIAFVAQRHQRRRLIDEFDQLPTQLADVGITGLQNLVDPGNVEQREQEMLDRHEFVTTFARVLERFVQAKFKFAG